MAQSGGATDTDTAPLLPPKILRQEVKPNAPPSAAGPAPSMDPAPGEGQSTESTAPPKKRNLANYGASNEDAARKEDDSRKSGTRGMLQNPKMRLYLATGIGSLPFLLSFMLYVSSFSFYGQLIIGILCGLLAEGVYFLFSLHRKHVRKSLVRDSLSFSPTAIRHISWTLSTRESCNYSECELDGSLRTNIYRVLRA